MGLQLFTCLSLMAFVTVINGRFILPLSPVETSTGLAADYYLRSAKPSSPSSSPSSLESSSSSSSIESKDDLESSHASPIGARSNGRSYERIQEATYQPAEPYNFGYDVRDDYGNRQYRKEESDASGTVRGSYGYTDANGLFRIVEYVADINGFRANIKTNEPGTSAQQAADIILSAENPPRGIVEAASAPKPVTEEPPKDLIKKQTESPIPTRGGAYDRLNRQPVETYLYRTALPLPSNPTSVSSSTSVSTSSSSSSSSSSSPSSSPSSSIEIEKERQ